MAPLFAITVALPAVDINLLSSSELNQAYPCLNDTRPNTYSTCDGAEIFADLYFWNITNAAAFLNGTEPPQLEEVGPLVFRVHRTIYNVAYDAQWHRINTSSHMWSVYDANATAEACVLGQQGAGGSVSACVSLEDPLYLINRYDVWVGVCTHTSTTCYESHTRTLPHMPPPSSCHSSYTEA